MDPLFLLVLLLVAGGLLFFAELFLPTHGLLGLLGVLCVAGALGACFILNRWLGAGALVATIVATPFAFNAMIALWQKTPIGRRMVLTTVSGTAGAQRPASLVGSVGKTVSELRPMGECEFNGERVQCRSESGMTLSPGTPVRLIDIQNTVAVVRPSGVVV